MTTTTQLGSIKSARRFLRWPWVVLCLLVIGLGWLALDLYGPRTTKLKEFSPSEVARLETSMWRAYYAKDRIRLFELLTETLRTQYNLPLARSHVVAYQAGEAAFIFKDGHNRSDYERALPKLERFYRDIRQVSDVPFDADKAARLELEWWIVHRERASYGHEELTEALAKLAAELYQAPIERVREHARLRAEAMTIRDEKAAAGGVSEADWGKINQLLVDSWQSLWQAVNS